MTRRICIAIDDDIPTEIAMRLVQRAVGALPLCSTCEITQDPDDGGLKLDGAKVGADMFFVVKKR